MMRIATLLALILTLLVSCSSDATSSTTITATPTTRVPPTAAATTTVPETTATSTSPTSPSTTTAPIVPVPAELGFTSFTSTQNVMDLALDLSGNLWVATEGGVILWDTKSRSHQHFVSEDGLASNGVNSIAIAPDGSVWFATFDAGVSRYEDGEWTTYVPEGEYWDLTSLAATPDGAIWVGTSNGVSRFDGRTWQTHREIAGQPVEYVRALAVDPDGALWLSEMGVESDQGSRPGYVAVFSDGRWSIPLTNPDVGGFLTSFAFAADGSLWSAGWPGVVVVADKETSVYTTGELANAERGWVRSGLPDSNVEDVAIAADGTPWAVTWLDGFAQFDGDDWEPVAALDELADLRPRRLLAHPDGGMWIATGSAGVYHYDGSNLDRLPLPSALPAGPRDVAVGADGVVWVATDPGGVARFDGATWSSYTTRDGLASDRLWAVEVAPDGTV